MYYGPVTNQQSLNSSIKNIDKQTEKIPSLVPSLAPSLIPLARSGNVTTIDKKKQKITLEHIMHKRVKDKEDDEVCAELHKELRNLERRTEIRQIQVHWKGATSQGGARGKQMIL